MAVNKREHLLDAISNLVASLNNKDRQDLLAKIAGLKETIPISVFKADISSLEIIVRYLKEVRKLSFKSVSKSLNRSPSTIYATYRNAKAKYKGKLDLSDSSVRVPFAIFSNRKFSVLEALVAYLMEKENLHAIDISRLLNKSQSTIRTVCLRYRIKKLRKKK